MDNALDDVHINKEKEAENWKTVDGDAAFPKKLAKKSADSERGVKRVEVS